MREYAEKQSVNKKLPAREILQESRGQLNDSLLQMASLLGNQGMLAFLEQQKESKPSATGKPLSDALREKFERKSGVPLDDVRVHYNSDKPEQLGAEAYAQGNEIHIGPGNEKDLEHEVGHVVQQKQGLVKATHHLDGSKYNLNPALEKEADSGNSGVANKSASKKAVDTDIIQGLFTFQMGEGTVTSSALPIADSRTSSEPVVKNFKYVRESGAFEHLASGKKEGKHTTADGIKKLFFDEGATYTVTEFWTRLKSILTAYTTLPGNSLIEGEAASTGGNSLTSILAKGTMEDAWESAIEKRKLAKEAMGEAMTSAKSAYTAKDWWHFQNFVIEVLHQFEIFSNLNPLVNLENGNNKGAAEGKAIGQIQKGTNIQKNVAALLDNGVFSLLTNDDIELYFPWIGSSKIKADEIKRLILKNHYHLFDAILDGAGGYENPIKGKTDDELDSFISDLLPHCDEDAADYQPQRKRRKSQVQP